MNYHLIFNNGQFELDCIGITYGYIPASYGGYVDRAPELSLTLKFEGGVPVTLYRVGKSGYTLEHIEVCPHENYPVGLNFVYVIINRIETEDGISKVFMLALRTSGGYDTVYGKIKEKHCITCGRNIHYNYVRGGMFEWLKPQTIYNLWNNELIDFYCCVCYKKRELYKL